jgi:hypothetical protein
MNRLFALLVGLIVLLPPLVHGQSGFNGTWRINLEETDKVSVDFEEGSGIQGRNLGRTSVSVMGLPLPSRAKAAPMSGLPAKDPAVLVCSEMQLNMDGNRVKLVYDSGARETLRRGEYRGRNTIITQQKIEQKYKTTERSVTKSWTLRDDGRLLVAVRIKYQGDKARTYSRVFDRAIASTADAG